MKSQGLRLHHIGVASADARAEATHWEHVLGYRVASDLIYDPEQQVRVLFLSSGRESEPLVELVEPAGEDSPVNRFIGQASRVYHVCYEVEDLGAALEQARAQGCLIVQRPVPAVAYGGRSIAWCYTPDRHLIEFLQGESGLSDADSGVAGRQHR